MYKILFLSSLIFSSVFGYEKVFNGNPLDNRTYEAALGEVYSSYLGKEGKEIKCIISLLETVTRSLYSSNPEILSSMKIELRKGKDINWIKQIEENLKSKKWYGNIYQSSYDIDIKRYGARELNDIRKSILEALRENIDKITDDYYSKEINKANQVLQKIKTEGDFNAYLDDLEEYL